MAYRATIKHIFFTYNGAPFKINVLLKQPKCTRVTSEAPNDCIKLHRSLYFVFVIDRNRFFDKKI